MKLRSPLLQWSRSLSTAEIAPDAPGSTGAGSRASMEPQPFDCGNIGRAAEGQGDDWS